MLHPNAKPIAAGTTCGRLTVLGFHEKGRGADRNSRYLCKCSCGRTKVVRGTHLRLHRVLSCGCLLREMLTRRNRTSLRTHGMYGTPTYKSWVAMLSRCRNSDKRGYGGRGIMVYRPWRDSFERFLRDVGPRPSLKHSLDRINNNSHYEPGNVRWATARQQATNRRTCVCPHCAFHRREYAVEPLIE